MVTGPCLRAKIKSRALKAYRPMPRRRGLLVKKDEKPSKASAPIFSCIWAKAAIKAQRTTNNIVAGCTVAILSQPKTLNLDQTLLTDVCFINNCFANTLDRNKKFWVVINNWPKKGYSSPCEAVLYDVVDLVIPNGFQDHILSKSEGIAEVLRSPLQKYDKYGFLDKIIVSFGADMSQRFA